MTLPSSEIPKNLSMEKPSVFFIPVVSDIHVERVRGAILRSRSLLEDAGMTLFGPRRPIRSLDELPTLKHDEYDAVVLFVASGGTGRLLAELGKDRDWFLWAYHENNSLSSALTARERLIADKNWRGQILYNNLSEAPPPIAARAYASRALKTLRGLRIGYVGDNEEYSALEATVNNLKSRFEIETIFISDDELRAEISLVQNDAANQIVKNIRRREVVEPSEDDMIKAARLYLALKELVKRFSLHSLTFDCYKYMKQSGVTPCLAFSMLTDEGFPSICERELQQAPLILLFTLLGGGPCWMANTSKLEATTGIATFAHCSAPMRLSEEEGLIRIRNHFESGLSVALDVPLKKGRVTIAHLTPEPVALTVTHGDLVEAQLSHWKLPRTQADVKMSCDITQFFDVTGNHHVIGYGDFTAILEQIGKQMRIPTVVVK